MSREKFYIDSIQPLVEQVFDLCKANGIAFHAVFDVTEETDAEEHFLESRTMAGRRDSPRIAAQAFIFQQDLGEDIMAIVRMLAASRPSPSPSLN